MREASPVMPVENPPAYHTLYMAQSTVKQDLSKPESVKFKNIYTA